MNAAKECDNAIAFDSVELYPFKLLSVATHAAPTRAIAFLSST